MSVVLHCNTKIGNEDEWTSHCFYLRTRNIHWLPFNWITFLDIFAIKMSKQFRIIRCSFIRNPDWWSHHSGYLLCFILKFSQWFCVGIVLVVPAVALVALICRQIRINRDKQRWTNKSSKGWHQKYLNALQMHGPKPFQWVFFRFWFALVFTVSRWLLVFRSLFNTLVLIKKHSSKSECLTLLKLQGN